MSPPQRQEQGQGNEGHVTGKAAVGTGDRQTVDSGASGLGSNLSSPQGLALEKWAFAGSCHLVDGTKHGPIALGVSRERRVYLFRDLE